MRIRLITDTYNPYFDDGAGIYVEALARDLSELGHHVSVATTTGLRGLESLALQEESVSPDLSVFGSYPLHLYRSFVKRS
jgi:hypothetical protein